jgi:hypothetical protein
MHRQTVFDQLDLEIIDQVYEATCAQLLARNPAHDATEEGERQTATQTAVRPCSSRRSGLRHALRQGAD